MVVHDLRNPAEAIRSGLGYVQSMVEKEQKKVLDQTERVLKQSF